MSPYNYKITKIVAWPLNIGLPHRPAKQQRQPLRNLDHVHLLVEYPATVALSRLVNSLKGVSSRMLRAREFPEVQRRLWGGHLWSPSYFAVSCGGAPIEIVRQYIEDQRK